MTHPHQLPIESLSVVLPAFNEELNVTEVVDGIVAFLVPRLATFEVIIVDDGSSDGTVDAVQLLMARYPQVRMRRHPANRGYGAALKTGYAAATMSHVFFTDCDGQFQIEDLPFLLAGLDEHPIVTGYRAYRRDGVLRKVNAALYNFFVVRLLFGTRVKDVNCAFKVFPRSFLERCRPLLSDGALINAEVFLQARWEGLSIGEVPVTHLPRRHGIQTGAKLSVILKMFHEALKLWLVLRESAKAKPSRAGLGFSSALLALAFALVTFWGVTRVPLADIGPTAVFDLVNREVPLTGIRELDSLRHLDAVWYLDIAQHGYQLDAGQSNVVFFPLLPMLMRGVHELTGIPLAVAGHLVVTLFTIIACVLLALYANRLLKVEGREQALPLFAVLMLLLHPMGLFLHAIYPESLFIALCLGLLMALESRRMVLVGVLAFLLALTRPQGLLVPMALVLVDMWRSAAARRPRLSPETVIVSLAAVAGIGLFALHLGMETGDPLSLWTRRVHWDKNASWLNIPRLLAPIITKHHLLPKLMLYATLAGSWMLWRRGERVAAVLCALLVIAPLHKGDLGDLTRYSLLAIPALIPFMALATRLPVMVFSGLGASACLYGIFLMRWLQHAWVG